jgi:hypothetical protein
MTDSHSVSSITFVTDRPLPQWLEDAVLVIVVSHESPGVYRVTAGDHAALVAFRPRRTPDHS